MPNSPKHDHTAQAQRQNPGLSPYLCIWREIPAPWAGLRGKPSSLGRFGAKSPRLLRHDWLRRARWERGGGAAATRAKRRRPGGSDSWRSSVVAPPRSAAMDLAAAAEPGAGSQHLEVRDEVAEKCQKLFLDFLEE